MDTSTKKRLNAIFSNFWIYLAVYFVLIAGPDYLPRIFVHHDQAPLRLSAVLSVM